MSDKYKDYVPEIIEYDEKRDGGFEYKVREEHLQTKEQLLAKFKAKQQKKSLRQNIRTENQS